METGKTQKIFYYILLLATAALIVVRIVKSTACGTPSFDSAMNYQVPMSLLRGNGYSTLFDGGTVFDESIQSSGPFLFLIAFFFKLFGTGSAQALAVNALFCVLLFLGFFLINKKLKVNAFLGIVLLALIAVTPHFWEYALGGYGEMPVLALLLWSVYVLIRTEERDVWQLFFLSGLLFSSAYLIKTVILIAVPVIALVFLVKLIRKELKVKHILVWICGLLLPVVLFEIYRLFQLGGSEGFIQYWSTNFEYVLNQAGVTDGYADTENIFEKLILHLQTYSSLFSVNFYVNIVVLAVNFLHWAVKVIRKRKFDYYDILILVAYFYFAWWMMITPTEKAWARRIIIGVLLMENSILYWADDSVKMLLERFGIRAERILLACCTVCLFFTGWKTANGIASVNNSMKTALQEDADFISEIRDEDEDAEFYGFGWWQSPVLAFLADDTFYNINSCDNSDNNKYLVLDYYVAALAADSAESLLNGMSAEEIYRNEITNTVIYKVENPFFDDFSEEEKTACETEWFHKTDSYAYLRGIYDYEENTDVRWARPQAAVLLSVNESGRLYFEYEILNYGSFEEKNNRMRIWLNGECVYEQKIEENGVYSGEISVDTTEETAEIVFDFNGTIDTEDSRNLSFAINEAGFVDETVSSAE